MASKRSGTKRSLTKAEQRRLARAVKAKADINVLARRAKREVTRLLIQNWAGTITRRELQTGLREVRGKLNQMLVFKQALM
jgi:hypothetical protein